MSCHDLRGYSEGVNASDFGENPRTDSTSTIGLEPATMTPPWWSFARRRRSKTSSFLPIHCPLRMEETQEQREWTTLGSAGVLLVEQWCAEKHDPCLFRKNRITYRVHCWKVSDMSNVSTVYVRTVI